MSLGTYNDCHDGNSTARSEVPDEQDRLSDLEDIPVDSGLFLELASFYLEHLEDYEPGGHHPV